MKLITMTHGVTRHNSIKSCCFMKTYFTTTQEQINCILTYNKPHTIMKRKLYSYPMERLTLEYLAVFFKI